MKTGLTLTDIKNYVDENRFNINHVNKVVFDIDKELAASLDNIKKQLLNKNSFIVRYTINTDLTNAELDRVKQTYHDRGFNVTIDTLDNTITLYY